jgi:hypothetical protein
VPTRAQLEVLRVLRALSFWANMPKPETLNINLWLEKRGVGGCDAAKLSRLLFVEL